VNSESERDSARIILLHELLCRNARRARYLALFFAPSRAIV
jgi:hypothetical protein